MRISIQRFLEGTAVLALAASLAACGGGTDATIGGSVSGLAAGQSVTLQNNNTDNLILSADQSFAFTTGMAAGAAYSVSVLTQPLGESCTVTNGVGTVDSLADNVSSVTVACSVTSSVGGTVSGLAAGDSVWLTLSNGQVLPIATNGSFAFPGILPAGSAYSVAVTTQPAQQTCTVTNGTGIVAVGAMGNVAISCN